VVAGSSIFALSAVAVDNEMVGNDSDGDEIGADGACWAAANKAAVAVVVAISAFAFGNEGKYWAKRFPLVVFGRDAPGAGGVAVVGVLLEKGFENRRVIVTLSLVNGRTRMCGCWL
jgi:hypothetical protein